jgi:hypothetical protein
MRDRNVGIQSQQRLKSVAGFKSSSHHPAVDYGLILAILLALAIVGVALLYAAVRNP